MKPIEMMEEYSELEYFANRIKAKNGTPVHEVQRIIYAIGAESLLKLIFKNGTDAKYSTIKAEYEQAIKNENDVYMVKSIYIDNCLEKLENTGVELSKKEEKVISNLFEHQFDRAELECEHKNDAHFANSVRDCIHYFKAYNNHPSFHPVASILNKIQDVSYEKSLDNGNEQKELNEKLM